MNVQQNILYLILEKKFCDIFIEIITEEEKKK